MSRTGAPSRWPAHCRIYRLLRDAGKPMLVAEIVAAACCAEHTTRRALKDLRDLGLCHISGWTRNTGGPGGMPFAHFKFGFGKDKPKPTPLAQRECRLRHYYKRKEKIIEDYGLHVWRRISKSRAEGGADRIMIDGQTVFQRQAPVMRQRERA